MFTERLLIPACTMFIERLAGDRQIAAQYTPQKSDFETIQRTLAMQV
jgi:hypothetical protein